MYKNTYTLIISKHIREEVIIMTNQQHQNQSNAGKNFDSISTTLIDVSPTLIGYTLTHRDLEETVSLILEQKGISFRGTSVEVDYDDHGVPHLLQYVYFNSSDKQSIIRKGGGGGGRQVNPALQGKLSTGGVRLADDVFNALRKIALPDGQTKAIAAKNGITVVPIDPTAVIAYALNAEPGLYTVLLTGVDVRHDTVIINAIKRLDRGGFNPKNTKDEFARALEQIGRRRRR